MSWLLKRLRIHDGDILTQPLCVASGINSINRSLTHRTVAFSQPPPLKFVQEVNKMDINALAGSLTTALVPFLPYLLKAGEKAAEETGKKAVEQSLEWAKSIWTKLKPGVEA